MRPRAKEHGIDLSTQFDKDIGPCHFDPDLIHHSLLNLVTNALDACIMIPVKKKKK